MQRRSLVGVWFVLMMCMVFSVSAATLESPTAGMTFKVHERVAFAGTSGAADGAIAVTVKDKRGVVVQSTAVFPDAGTWKATMDPPRGGWPTGEMTVEIFSGKEGVKQASRKITFEK